jgi:hypothetical protein
MNDSAYADSSVSNVACGNGGFSKRKLGQLVMAASALFACVGYFQKGSDGSDRATILVRKEHNALSYSSKKKVGASIPKARNSTGTTVTISDLHDIDDGILYGHSETTWDESNPVLEILKKAGISIDIDILKILPNWDDVKELYGDKPVIVGMNTCAKFRRANNPRSRFVGVAGQMNSGTNALGKYLFENLSIRMNQFGGGMLAYVPWHKHGWISLRDRYKFGPPQDVNSVLPVVIIRDPYFWMQSK